MPCLPEPAAFCQTYNQGVAQAVYTTHLADLETPVGTYIKLAQDAPTFLLESVEDGDVRGRYSIIGLAPDLIFRVVDGTAQINRNALDTAMPDAGADYETMPAPPLDALRAVLAESALSLPDDLAPMAAGIFGYMSYDMVRYMEQLPDANPDTLNIPDCLFVRPTLVLVFDNVRDIIMPVVPVRPCAGVSAEDAYAAACAQIEDALAKLKDPMPDAPLITPHDFVPPSSNMHKDDYFSMVEKSKAYIEAGDAFQIVVSQRFETAFTLPPLALYRSLRNINPSPYLFLFEFGDFALVGSSPEVLVGVENRVVNIRPIAGTRKRGQTAAEDKAIGEELLADEKERAEHLMLLDLGRNDVGRVAEIGSIKVNVSFGLQKTSHLIHIVSDITGTLRDDCDVIDALVAGFPAGTVSGAPKIRAMEIIDELEPVRRSYYAGCVGYFCANGDMVSSITLRTALVKDGKAYVQAGGGVVYDSTPQYEYDETVNKAAALFRAAEVALANAAERGNR